MAYRDKAYCHQLRVNDGRGGQQGILEELSFLFEETVISKASPETDSDVINVTDI